MRRNISASLLLPCLLGSIIVRANEQGTLGTASNQDYSLSINRGLIALQEKRLKEAYLHFLDDKLLEELKREATASKKIDSEWLNGVENLLQSETVIDQEGQMRLLWAIGELYIKAGNLEEAFPHAFQAYKIGRDLNKTSFDTKPLLDICRECTDTIAKFSPKDPNDKKAEQRRKNAQYSLFGYELHSYLSDMYKAANKIEQSIEESKVSESYLIRTILAGNNDALEEILNNSDTLFPSPFEMVLFFRKLLDQEWEQWGKKYFFECDQKSYSKSYSTMLYYYKMKVEGRDDNNHQYNEYNAILEPVDPTLIDKIQTQLMQLFFRQELDEKIKYVSAITLFMLQGPELFFMGENSLEFSSLYDSHLRGNYVYSSNHPTVKLLNEHKDTIVKFMRDLKIDEKHENFHFVCNIQKTLQNIFEKGLNSSEIMEYADSKCSDNMYFRFLNHRQIVLVKKINAHKVKCVINKIAVKRERSEEELSNIAEKEMRGEVPIKFNVNLESNSSSVDVLKNLIQGMEYRRKEQYKLARNSYQDIKNSSNAAEEDTAQANFQLAHMDWLGEGLSEPNLKNAFSEFELLASSNSSGGAINEIKARAILYLTEMKKKMQAPRANFLPKDRLIPKEIENIKGNYQKVINHPDVLDEDKAYAIKQLEKIS